MLYDEEAISSRKFPLKRREPFAEGDFLFSFFDEPNLFRSIDNAWYDFVSDFSWREEDHSQKRFVELLLTPSAARKGGEITLDVPFQIPCSRCLGTGRMEAMELRQGGNVWKKVTGYDPPGGEGKEVRLSIQAPTHRPLELIVTIRVSRR
jgi:hypothetical protein